MALSKLREKENELNEREKVLAEKEADFAAKESKLKELEQKLASGGSIPVAYVATTTVQKSTDPSQLKRVKLDVGNRTVVFMSNNQRWKAFLYKRWIANCSFRIIAC